MKSLCLLLVLAAGVLFACDADRGPDAGHRGTGDRLIGRTHPETQTAFSLVMKFDDDGLARYVRAVNDRHSRLYRHFLTPAAIGKRYGAPRSAIDEIKRGLRRAGLASVVSFPQRTAIHARGAARIVARYFDTEYGDFVDGAGVVYHAPLRPPRLSADESFRRWVAGVVGLDTRPSVRPASVRGRGLTPLDAATAYNFAPLHARGIDGAGQTIAIASYARFTDDDVRRFDRRFRISGPFPEHVPVAEGVLEAHPEANLDVQVVRAVAPRARILVYEAPNTEAGELLMFDRIAADTRVSLVTLSWGTCDRPVSVERRNGLEQELTAAVARGVSIFVASGDAGAYDCQRTNFADHRLTVNYPADSPNVIAVGGTLLSVRRDGTYLSEVAWEDLLSNAGGGGGVNPVDPRPPWQRARGLPEPDLDRRGVPDISAAASPGSPWLISDRGTWQQMAGTSAAAPFWASSMLLVQQWADQRGAGRICFAARILYELADSAQRFPPFHDVTAGGNRHFRADVGWDYATGLGSPDVWNLARSMVIYLKGRGVKRSCP
ncbi:MAG: S53 family peptidase [Gaiellales bacterium]